MALGFINNPLLLLSCIQHDTRSLRFIEEKSPSKDCLVSVPKFRRYFFEIHLRVKEENIVCSLCVVTSVVKAIIFWYVVLVYRNHEVQSYYFAFRKTKQATLTNRSKNICVSQVFSLSSELLKRRISCS